MNRRYEIWDSTVVIRSVESDRANASQPGANGGNDNWCFKDCFVNRADYEGSVIGNEVIEKRIAL